jgi:hypothetical protein
MSKRCEPDTLSESGVDTDKKQKVVCEYREWSSVAETSDEPITHYTIKVYHGDPDQKLPSCLKQAKKEDIINHMMAYRGFLLEDCVGTKDNLLHKLQFNRPFVTIKIDGREGLQRVLSTALSQFGWSCDHLFNAKMPNRGTLTVGNKTYQDILVPDDFTEFEDFNDQMYRKFILGRVMIPRRRNRMKSMLDSELVHLSQSERDAIFEDVCNFAIHRLDIAPIRAFRGDVMSPVTMLDCDIDDDDANQEFLVSLNDLALRAGDRIYYEYDYGSPSTFIAEILECQENQSLLPEIFADNFSTIRNVRAIVVEESSNKICRQYRH